MGISCFFLDKKATKNQGFIRLLAFLIRRYLPAIQGMRDGTKPGFCSCCVLLRTCLSHIPPNKNRWRNLIRPVLSKWNLRLDAPTWIVLFRIADFGLRLEHGWHGLDGFSRILITALRQAQLPEWRLIKELNLWSRLQRGFGRGCCR